MLLLWHQFLLVDKVHPRPKYNQFIPFVATWQHWNLSVTCCLLRGLVRFQQWDHQGLIQAVNVTDDSNDSDTDPNPVTGSTRQWRNFFDESRFGFWTFLAFPLDTWGCFRAGSFSMTPVFVLQPRVQPLRPWRCRVMKDDWKTFPKTKILIDFVFAFFKIFTFWYEDFTLFVGVLRTKNFF